MVLSENLILISRCTCLCSMAQPWSIRQPAVAVVGCSPSDRTSLHSGFPYFPMDLQLDVYALFAPWSPSFCSIQPYVCVPPCGWQPTLAWSMAALACAPPASVIYICVVMICQSFRTCNLRMDRKHLARSSRA